MPKILIVLLGPTGVGKTDLAVEFAAELGCDIISCDSRQFYREMSIGTAVPDNSQLKKARHHFIKFLSVQDYYSASRYETDVLNLLTEIFSKNNLVLLTGGSAMYIDAVCCGYDDIPDTDPGVRDKYNSMYLSEGIESLRVALKVLDPEHYGKVDLKNHKRIIRALEICESTGRPYSAFLKNDRKSRDFRILKIGLNRPRKELYERIDKRVDKMLESGLENEALSLYEFRHLNALNTVGYKEFFDYFDGKISREKAVELIKRDSRRYAKRQLTWWARDEQINWFHPDQKVEIFEFIRRNV
jgi:tRNA dimethylallyltransferase